MINMPELEYQGNRPLRMTFEDHLKALVYFHLEEQHSAQHLLQVHEQDDFVRDQIAPGTIFIKAASQRRQIAAALNSFSTSLRTCRYKQQKFYPKNIRSSAIAWASMQSFNVLVQ